MSHSSSILMKYAINYLSKYSSSKANIERILKNKIRRLDSNKEEKYLLYSSIDKIICDLEKNNFINDFNYSYSKMNLFFNQGKSKIFIKSYFLQKGIDKEIISNILEEYENKNNDWEVESAKIFARKKRLANYIEDKEKILSKLARAGFSYDISKKILDEI